MDVKKLSDKDLQDKIQQLYFATTPNYDLCADLILEGLERDNGFAKSVAADALYYDNHGFKQNLKLSWEYACETHWAGWPMGAYVLAKFYRDRGQYALAQSLLEDVQDKSFWAKSLLINLRAERGKLDTHYYDFDTNGHNRLDAFNFYLLKACRGDSESCRIVGDIISKVPAYGVMAPASFWYEKGALCASPDPTCLYKTACNYTNQKRHKEAFDLYMKAYNKGYTRAAVQIAHALWFEIGVKRSDHIKEARKYFIEAAKHHGREDTYDHSRYIEPDYVITHFFLMSNSEDVSAEEWYELGSISHLYLRNTLSCLEKAAELGHEKAKFECAKLYNDAYESDKNYGSKKKASPYLEKAIYWFRHASDSNRERELLEIEKMSPIIRRKKRPINTSWLLKSTGGKIAFFVRILLLILAIVLIRRMDQMSYRPISEEQALEMAQEVKIAIPDQEIKLLDKDGSQALKTGSTVKVLGIYKPQLNEGDSPLVLDNPCYLLQFADSTRGYGPLIEAAIGQRTVLPEGDTVTITAVKKTKSGYAYTLEGRKQQYASEDLNIVFPECVTYYGDGLREEDFAPIDDTTSTFQSFIGKTKKFIFYDIRPATKKNGFFLFPKHQKWNEFKLGGRFRPILIWMAYIIEILLILIILNRFFKGTKFAKTIIFLFFALVVIQFRRMDQMSYKPINEEQAMELAQEVKITNPDQEVTLLDTDTLVTQTLKKKSTVKVLGVYKPRLNKGASPLEPENRQYLMLLPDSTRAYGPLAEEVILPQGLTYLGEGLSEEDYVIPADSISWFQSFIGKAKKLFLYDIRPVTKKNGFFLFPKYRNWNEYHLPYWLRITMIVLAYIIEIILILWVYFALSFLIKILKAKAGNARACYQIGLDHLNDSTDIEHDEDLGLQWIRIAADKGYGRACAKLGNMYEDGHLLDVDLFLAKLYYNKGAAKGNKTCKEGEARLGKLLDWNSDEDFPYVYLYAHRGNSDNQWQLGYYFQTGEYVAINDEEAVRWYKKAVDQGHAVACCSLGDCYASGIGVDKDIQIAISLYKKSIAKGETISCSRLGDLYYYGEEVPKNLNTAIYYYELGAKEKDSYSMYSLGYMYYSGEGISKNQNEGLRWIKMAASAGDKNAINFLDKLGITDY